MAGRVSQERRRKRNEPWFAAFRLGENTQKRLCAVILKTLSLMFKRRDEINF